MHLQYNLDPTPEPSDEDADTSDEDDDGFGGGGNNEDDDDPAASENLFIHFLELTTKYKKVNFLLNQHRTELE